MKERTQIQFVLLAILSIARCKSTDKQRALGWRTRRTDVEHEKPEKAAARVEECGTGNVDCHPRGLGLV